MVWKKYSDLEEFIISDITCKIVISIFLNFQNVFQFGGPEITWIDGQKPIFHVNFRLSSTVLTMDQHLHNLFTHAERLQQPKVSSFLPPETETCKILKVIELVSNYKMYIYFII